MPPASLKDRPITAYRITTTATTTRQETEVTLIGPGLDSWGQRYVFADRSRAETFVWSLNFAYAQGIKEGLEMARAGVRSPDAEPQT